MYLFVLFAIMAHVQWEKKRESKKEREGACAYDGTQLLCVPSPLYLQECPL